MSYSPMSNEMPERGKWYKIYIASTTVIFLVLLFWCAENFFTLERTTKMVINIVELSILVVAAVLRIPCRKHLGLQNYQSGVDLYRSLPRTVKVTWAIMIGIAIILVVLSVLL